MGQPIIADLSLDLDNKWSYLKTHGDPSWSDFPSYLDTAVPHILKILGEHELKITVFVVGKDATIASNQTALRALVADGHEIGNHSFLHEPWLQRYSRDQIREEFDRAEAALATITDRPLRGFRGPGYSLSNDILELLCERKYLFDASTLPTFLGPMARMYFFLKSNFSKAEKSERDQLFGSISDGLRSIQPYFWQTKQGRMLELPVTTMPLFRTPIHFSYLNFLAQFSEPLAILYFRMALTLCRLFRVGPSMLLHPTDFLGGDDCDKMEYFPAMKLNGERKRAFVSKLLGIYKSAFEIHPMSVRAERLLNERGERLPVRKFQSTPKADTTELR